MAVMKVSIRDDGLMFPWTEVLGVHKRFRTALWDSESKQEVLQTTGMHPGAAHGGNADEPRLPADLPVLAMPETGPAVTVDAPVTAGQKVDTIKHLLRTLGRPALCDVAQMAQEMIVEIERQDQEYRDSRREAAPPEGQAPPAVNTIPDEPEVAALQSAAELREHCIAVFGVPLVGRTKPELRAMLNGLYRARKPAPAAPLETPTP